MFVKKIIVSLLALFGLLASASAQLPKGYTIVDSLIFTRKAAVDTAIMGRTIYDVMPYNVRIYQSDDIRGAVSRRIESNDAVQFSGYRIRIFFDNSQNARGASSSVLYRFKMLHPDVSAYRTFDNPNFKVTVGDYRTRSEALAALKVIQAEFPSAFIVREKFKYPSFSGEDDFKVDTLRVLRKL